MTHLIRPVDANSASLLSQLHIACFGKGWGPAEFLSFFERGNIIAAVISHSPHEGESQRQSVAHADAVGGIMSTAIPHDSASDDVLASSAPPQGGSTHYIGFTFAWVVADECEILALGVIPNVRSKGLGTKLLDYTMQAAKKGGAQEAFLEVRVDNEAALALYRKAEFAMLGRRKNYYRKPDGTRKDAVTMRKKL